MLRALRGSFWAPSLPGFVLGGMCMGVFTVTEAAAGVCSHALTKMRIPQEILALVTAYGLGPIESLLAVMLLVLVLGMFLETISIIPITTPIFLPVLTVPEINPVWYGVLLMINLELALIIPPVGMKLSTIKVIARAPVEPIILGVRPYTLILIAGLALVLAFPSLALWLPSTMFGR